MNRLYLFLLFSLSTFIISCSSNVSDNKSYDLTKIADSTLAEGYEMFYLERASWISTDLILEYYKDFAQIKDFFGYITYRQNDSIKSIYLQKIDNVPTVFATFTFSSKEPNSKDVDVNALPRKLTDIESILVKCRDTTFKALVLANNQMEELYKENNYDYKKVLKEYKQNIVFMVEEKRIRVFAIQGVEEFNVIPFGNDYCFTFDKEGDLLYGGFIHPAIVSDKEITPNFDFVKQKRSIKGKYEEVCSHNHYGSTPEFITSTDVCNYLLYGKSDYLFVISRIYSSLMMKEKDRYKILIMKNEDLKNFLGK